MFQDVNIQNGNVEKDHDYKFAVDDFDVVSYLFVYDICMFTGITYHARSHRLARFTT